MEGLGGEFASIRPINLAESRMNGSWGTAIVMRRGPGWFDVTRSGSSHLALQLTTAVTQLESLDRVRQNFCLVGSCSAESTYESDTAFD